MQGGGCGKYIDPSSACEGITEAPAQTRTGTRQRGGAGSTGLVAATGLATSPPKGTLRGDPRAAAHPAPLLGPSEEMGARSWRQSPQECSWTSTGVRGVLRRGDGLGGCLCKAKGARTPWLKGVNLLGEEPS